MLTKAPLDREKLKQITTSHARWAGGLGLGTVFIPLADLLVMGTIWTSLIVQIANATGHEVDNRYAKKFAGSVVKGALLYLAGSRLGTWLISLTGVGAPGAMVANAALNYGYTWLLGGFLIEQFSRPDVDLSGLAKSAVTYLLSFGISEVAHLRDVHDAANTVADVHHVATTAADAHSAATDLHHATTTIADAHHAATTTTDVHHAVTSATDAHHAVTTAADAHGAFGHTYSLAHHSVDPLRFTGLDHTDLIAGAQGQHPWCGVHSLGNLVQLNYPGLDEQINDYILNVAQAQGALVPATGGMTLDINHFQPILSQVFHIPSHWDAFDPARAFDLLRQNHGILAVGDAHFLNPAAFPQPNAWHAFNLTDFKIDGNGMTWFKGLDSNVVGKEVWWPADAIQKALARGLECYGKNILVTDSSVAWPWKHA